MKRRTFLKRGLAGAAGVGAASLTPGCARPDGPSGAEGPAVVTGKRVRWRLASSFPRSLDTIFGSAEVFAERVRALSGGRFEIRVHPAGEIVPGLQVLDAVQQGTVQVGHTASYYYTGKSPVLAFDTCVPFGMTARQQTAWLEAGGGRELLARDFADFGVIAFTAGNTGAQMGGWFKEPVGGLESLRGLKIRIPGMGGDVMAALGASVQVIAGGEIFPALERGAIDATEWVGPHDDEKLGFYKVAENYYYPGWWEPGPSLSLYVGRAAWDALSDVHREIVRSAALESATAMQVRYDALNPAALARLLDEGVRMREFSQELMRGAREASEQLLADEAARDPRYREVFEHWNAFREESFRWFGTAEHSYARFAYGSG